MIHLPGTANLACHSASTRRCGTSHRVWKCSCRPAGFFPLQNCCPIVRCDTDRIDSAFCTDHYYRTGHRHSDRWCCCGCWSFVLPACSDHHVCHRSTARQCASKTADTACDRWSCEPKMWQWHRRALGPNYTGDNRWWRHDDHHDTAAQKCRVLCSLKMQLRSVMGFQKFPFGNSLNSVVCSISFTVEWRKKATSPFSSRHLKAPS